MRRWVPPAIAVGLAVLVVAGGVLAAAARDAGGLRSPAGLPPATGAGSAEVQLSAYAGDHPAADVVREQLQRYFDAINAKDYAGWRDTVVPRRSAALPEDAWLDAYATTQDGTIRVDRIDPADDPDAGLLVRLRFISTQAAEDAPPDMQAPRICWRSTLPMRGLPPRIDVTGGGSTAAAAC